VAASIATVSKVAAVGILLGLAALGPRATFGDVLASVSMPPFNLAAPAQQDLKRLPAYSSVALGGITLWKY
jgi:NADH:ubiquinone oxidoreductase subunit 2 (subunit N)